jgi:hypothetical protein
MGDLGRSMAIWVRICQVDRHRPFEADWLVVRRQQPRAFLRHPRQDQGVPLAGARSHVAEQSRLSDARLAHNHERPAPVGKAIKNCVETLHLSIAADQPKPRRMQMRLGHHAIIGNRWLTSAPATLPAGSGHGAASALAAVLGGDQPGWRQPTAVPSLQGGAARRGSRRCTPTRPRDRE